MPTNYDRAAIEINTTYTTPVSYSTLSLLDFIEQKNQLEVYRKDIESRWETVNGSSLTLTREERNNFGIVKPEWITVNTTTKAITGITIPVDATFTRENGSSLTYPAMASGEALRIKRKTINSETLVEWVNGSRITADQLNLLATQMIGIGQENLHELENNVVKLEDAGVTFTTPEYVNQQIDILQDQIGLASSISNLTNYDQRLIYLVRAGSENIPTVLNNIRWNNTNNTLSCYLASSQTNNILEFRANTGTLLNYFNSRGVLNQAGRVYYGASAPSPAPNASDTGLLWWDTSGTLLRVWDGSAWQSAGIVGDVVGVTNTQTISGQKTFTATANYFGNATAGTGTETFTKSLILRPEATGGVNCFLKGYVYPGDADTVDRVIGISPWNGTAGTPAYKTVLTCSVSSVTVASGVAFDCYVLGNNAKAVICTVDTSQTITGNKTFTGGVIYFGSVDNDSHFIANRGLAIYNKNPTQSSGINWGRLLVDSGTDWENLTGGTIIANSFASNAALIQIMPDFLNKDNATRPGINLRARNPLNNGELVVDGNTRLKGDLIFNANTHTARNITGIRFPGMSGKVLSLGNSAVAGHTFQTGLKTVPEATISIGTVTTTLLPISIQRTNTPYTQKYRLCGFNGGSVLNAANYVVPTVTFDTPGAGSTTVDGSTGAIIITLNANTTVKATLTVPKLTSGLGGLAYIEWTVLE